MMEILQIKPKLESLAFKENEIPEYLIRMKAAAKNIKKQQPNLKILVMDTALAAILGCLQDEAVERSETVLAVNIGNSHTIAAILVKMQVIALMEHHTNMLTSKKLEETLIKFKSGKLDGKIVFKEGGHGAFYLNENFVKKIDSIIVTGPKRKKIIGTQLKVYFANPGEMLC